MNVQTTEQTIKPSQADLLALLPPGKKANQGKAKPTVQGKAKPLSPHKSKLAWFTPDTTAFTGPMLPLLGKASKNAKRGVFNDMGLPLEGKIITNCKKATLAKYGKVKAKCGKRTVNEALGYQGIGIKGDVIKTVIKSNEALKGDIAFAVIWQAIDNYRAANKGEMPTAKYLNGLNLQCIKKGQSTYSVPSPITVSRQIWAYKLFYGMVAEKV